MSRLLVVIAWMIATLLEFIIAFSIAFGKGAAFSEVDMQEKCDISVVLWSITCLHDKLVEMASLQVKMSRQNGM